MIQNPFSLLSLWNANSDITQRYRVTQQHNYIIKGGCSEFRGNDVKIFTSYFKHLEPVKEDIGPFSWVIKVRDKIILLTPTLTFKINSYGTNK